MNKMMPNIVSLSRVIIAPFIVLSAVNNSWQLAFALVALGLLTDWLDGWLAIKLNVVSGTGEKIDTYCDFLFSCGVVGGLVVSGIVFWDMASTLAVIAVTALVIGAYTTLSALSAFCRRFMFLYYLVVILTAGALYASMALGRHAVWLLLPAAAFGVITLKIKKHHLLAELQGG